MVPFDADALVVGAGPAGAASAILMAQAGWHVVLVEQHVYPRRKVCGECVAAGNLPLLDQLGIGALFRAAAGPELKRTAWMGGSSTVIADMPVCTAGSYRFGRALGRDKLDSALADRARASGVAVLQPARVRRVSGSMGDFECTIDAPRDPASRCTLRVPVVVDAHGSWERGPAYPLGEASRADAAADGRRLPRPSDLFAFKANYRNSALLPGLLPVLALAGGYGGMVVADDARTTVACCLRRDALAECRVRLPGETAGAAVEAYLRSTCQGARITLRDATREGPWLSVGPLQPGIRLGASQGVFRVGNAAGESHALIGEGITMALQSAALLVPLLTHQPAAAVCGRLGGALHQAYAAAWRRAFETRLRLAAVYAHVAMRPPLAAAAHAFLHRWPTLLSNAALLAGKAAGGTFALPVTTEMV